MVMFMFKLNYFALSVLYIITFSFFFTVDYSELFLNTELSMRKSSYYKVLLNLDHLWNQHYVTL